jgi:hypothetical protein
MLRESDLELFKLNEYAGGINVAPSRRRSRSILKTKLYKARFRQLLRDSGLARRPEPAERSTRIR